MHPDMCVTKDDNEPVAKKAHDPLQERIRETLVIVGELAPDALITPEKLDTVVRLVAQGVRELATAEDAPGWYRTAAL